jgi:hypothetical protein
MALSMVSHSGKSFFHLAGLLLEAVSFDRTCSSHTERMTTTTSGFRCAKSLSMTVFPRGMNQREGKPFVAGFELWYS